MDPAMMPHLEDLAMKLYCSTVPHERQQAEQVKRSPESRRPSAVLFSAKMTLEPFKIRK